MAAGRKALLDFAFGNLVASKTKSKVSHLIDGDLARIPAVLAVK